MSGVYVVLIGPFGVGKSSLAKVLTNGHWGQFRYKVEKQVTSRQKRPDENDFEYEFVSKEDFEQNRSKYLIIQPNRGVDWNYALKQPSKLTNKTVHLYIVLPETAEFLRKKYPDTVVCAILPVSIKILKKQLLNRDNSISDAELKLRFRHLESDITKAKDLADLIHYNEGNINNSAKILAGKIEDYLIKNRIN